MDDPACDELRVPANVVGIVDAPGDTVTDPPSDPNAEKTNALLGDVLVELRRGHTINVDARTSVAPTTIDVAAPTIHMPEQKAGDVHVDVAAPQVHMAPTEISLNVESDGNVATTTYRRNSETKELESSTTVRTKS